MENPTTLTQAFYDKNTNTLTYVVYDPRTRDAVVVDPVLDLDGSTFRTSTKSLSEVVLFLNTNQLIPHYVLETHVHADHITGAQALKPHFPQIKVAISRRIIKVQQSFKEIFQLAEGFSTEGLQFDLNLKDEEVLKAGSLSIKVWPTPGHTPVCTTFQIGEDLYTGDALFMPDSGTGRCDFPQGSAKDLYHSIHQRLYQFPDSTRYFTGHDYQPGGRELRYQSTIGEAKKNNIHLRQETSEQEFVNFRNERDKTLSMPKLFFYSVQVNVNAGFFPLPEKNGVRYLKIPLDQF